MEGSNHRSNMLVSLHTSQKAGGQMNSNFHPYSHPNKVVVSHVVYWFFLKMSSCCPHNFLKVCCIFSTMVMEMKQKNVDYLP